MTLNRILEQLAAVLPPALVVSVVAVGSALLQSSLGVVSFHWAARDPGINKRFGVGMTGGGRLWIVFNSSATFLEKQHAGDH